MAQGRTAQKEKKENEPAPASVSNHTVYLKKEKI